MRELISVPRLLAKLKPALLAAAIASAGCVGEIGEPGESDGPGSQVGPQVLQPAAPVLPRLTALQYRNALTDLLGDGLPDTPVEADTNPYLFYSVGSTSTSLSEYGAQQYEANADAVTHWVFDNPLRRAALVGCDVLAAGDECTSDFLAKFGRKALRRPLTQEELARWVGVAAANTQPDVWEGLRLAVAGLLQSTHFLYRVELGTPYPAIDGRRVVKGYEMASRLSFLLWNTTPDDELLDAAERGELDDVDGIALHADRLLADERSRTAIRSFFAQYLDLGRLDGVVRSEESYPLFAGGMKDAMRKEVELLVDDVVFAKGGDARSIFSTRHTFVNDQLAALYGVSAPGADATTFVPVDLPAEGPRAGLLTLGAFLTMNAHETQTSPTARGKYVRERVLCQTVQAPPPDVDTTLDPPDPSKPQTVREKLEEHRKNPACAGCHSFIDPPGFLFEHFDSIGAVRTTEVGGLPIDSTGELDGQPLADARALAEILADDERVGRCMVTQLYRHAQGRLETKGEKPAIDELSERFADADYDFRELIVELVTHDGFRFVTDAEENP
ncbi:MAG: DUF1592 domain-containing protein [Polyangiaceae bacterium]|nr:DUF1592 domain-containing protein [Polyangiaceae bacterium]